MLLKGDRNSAPLHGRVEKPLARLGELTPQYLFGCTWHFCCPEYSTLCVSGLVAHTDQGGDKEHTVLPSR